MDEFKNTTGQPPLYRDTTGQPPSYEPWPKTTVYMPPLYAPNPADQTGCVPLVTQPPMSLRDWFAGMALQGILAGEHLDTLENMVGWAYKYAEAMLKAREASNG